MSASPSLASVPASRLAPRPLGSVPPAASAGDASAATGSAGAGSHLVSWSMPLDAEDAVDAARQALGIMRDPESVATVFTVTDPGGRQVVVDVEDDAAPVILASHGPWREPSQEAPWSVYLVTFDAEEAGELFATPGVSFRACAQAVRAFIGRTWDAAAAAELATFPDHPGSDAWYGDPAGDRWTAEIGLAAEPGAPYRVTITRWELAVEAT